MIALQRESPAAAQWSQPQYEALVVTAFATASGEQPSQRLAWIAEDDGEAPRILGFLVAQRVDHEWELENIVVAAATRRQGVGTQLLENFIAQARAQHAHRIFLEVRESNQTARTLYRKLGFEESGLRKGYYSNPSEHAILCSVRLC